MSQEKSKNKEPIRHIYRLNMYTAAGLLRHDLSSATVYNMGGRFGDIIKAIPSNDWMTADEIADSVWRMEQRSYTKQFERTRKQIDDAIQELVDASLLLVK